MAERCKGYCVDFEGYRGGSGPNMYKNGMIFCTTCNCGYKKISVKCPCCKHFVRHQTWVGRTRKTRLATTPRIG